MSRPDAPGAAAGTRGGADPDEVARLRAELAVLRGRLDARRRRAALAVTSRRLVAAVAVAAAAFAFVASVVGLWAAHTALDTDRWVATVAPLPRNPPVAAAVAEYAGDELFGALDV